MPSPVAADPKRRIPIWDNARFAAIVLVVVGHAILRLTPALDPASVLYLVVYTFHIPLLVLVSGYFAKDSLDRRGLTRLVTDLAVPYLIFETIWTIVRFLVEGADNVNYASPSWTLWFLLALIAWRLLLPLLAVTRFPLLAAIGISIASGLVSGLTDTFALARMLGLLPFFVLGWHLRNWRVGGRDITDLWERASSRVVVAVRASAAALFIALTVVISVGLLDIRAAKLRRFLYFDESYGEIGYPQWSGALIRLAVMLVATLFCAAFLVLLPRRATWITPLGAATLYVYLLHTAFLYPLRETGVIEANPTVLTLVLMLLLSVGIALLLSSKPVRWLFRPLIEPRIPWLLAPAPEKPAER